MEEFIDECFDSMRLDSRGHEIPDPVPFEPAFRVKKPFDMVAHVRAMMERERAALDDEIRTEDDALADALDFDVDTFTDDLLVPSPYELSEDVPNAYVKPAPSAESAEVKKDASPSSATE